MSVYADIIINRNSPAVDRVFTYAVPEQLQASLLPGALVRVPFKHEQLEGVVIALHDDPPAGDFAVRSIISQVGERPLFQPELLQLAEWMSEYYLCSRAAALQAMLPAAMRLSGAPSRVYVRDYYRLAPQWQQVKATPRRRELAGFLQAQPQGEAEKNVLLAAGFSTAFIQAQLKAGLLLHEQRRHSEFGAELSPHPSTLNDEQRQVFRAVLYERSRQKRPFLLHGITGSGKTELYLRLIRETLSRGQGAIVLVPEIALSTQMVEMLSFRLEQPPAVLHSALRPAQRRQIWQDIAEGRVRCVVGARSAIFAPLPDLGLIIIDEAHESSYKQDNTPRFNALTVAEKRAELCGAMLLLGSATPLVEQYYAAAVGRYAFGQLQHRYHSAPLPEVELVDMREELRCGNKSIFSYRLQEELDEVLEHKEQAVLLLNRRGYYQHFSCRECGQPVRCPHCAVALSYHGNREGGILKCHYCGLIKPTPRLCPTCGAKSIRSFGVGTQRVVEELLKRWPQAHVGRLDSDVVEERGAHERIYRAMKQGELDILVGTQMVAKGLDFPRLTLAAVVAADSQLNLPDWRAGERVFQQITQLIGRAGRRDKQGIALIQTYAPEAMPIATAAEGDYLGFYQAELQNRYLHAYPPFTRLIRVLFTSTDSAALRECAQEFVAYLRPLLAENAEICGPADAPLLKLKDRYRRQLILKCAADDLSGAAALRKAEQLLRQRYKCPRDLLIAVDVDPFSVM